jgi:hypothetical protein
MKYRAVVHVAVPVVLSDAGAVTFKSEAFLDQAGAQATLDLMLAMPGVTGGGLEAHVPPMGWVVFDSEVDLSNQVDRARELQWDNS